MKQYKNLIRICLDKLTLVVAVAILFSLSGQLYARLGLNQPNTVTLVNGSQIQGRVGSVPRFGATLADLAGDSSQHGIVVIDDEIRRVLVSRFNIANKVPFDLLEEEFEIWQKVHEGDGESSAIGPILHTGPFNEFGRREITTQTYRGPETVIQGITLVNPRYVRLQGVAIGGKRLPERHWDMRIATTAIPTDVLVKILHRNIKDPDNANERIRIVDFFAQAKKFRQAEAELKRIRRDFPGLQAELKRRGELLRAQITRQVLNEARLRRESGQPETAASLIQPLENSLGIASAILVDINEAKKELIADMASVEIARENVLKLGEQVLASDEIDGQIKRMCEKFIEDIRHSLSINNVDRLSTYMRLYDDPEQKDQQKLALAMSGWVIGAGSATENLGLAQSLMLAQALVIEYLQTPRGERRAEILDELERMEAGAPQYVAKIIAHIKPPLAPSPNEIPIDRPMEYKLEIGPLNGEMTQARYLVQLPPEYRPDRRYPCVVTLGGGTVNTTPEAQIDWWAGRFHPKWQMRVGQAARNGMIVIAPDWMDPRHATYQYSAKEHMIVLKSLRHAMRRFSIDTDRVFLSGHYAGGVAAWDIGQAHPEHWAGIIPISARAGKYINHYRNNTKYHLPFYFVNGARDFDSLEANSTIWNHRARIGFDTIVVQYRGRGTEKFSDELPNIVRWMRPIRRQFTEVREFECSTLRPWDNYFWWFEVDLSGNAKMIDPARSWSSQKLSAWDISGRISETTPNLFFLSGAQDRAALWLLPELVDFDKNIEIRGSSGNFRGPVQPSRQVILEDTRRRADRQHPYWAKIQRGSGNNKRWRVAEK